MTRIRKFTLMSAAATLAVSTMAFANPKADTNQDGQITKSEFIAAADAKFQATDIDRDGFITETERETHRTAMRANKRDEHFNKLDTNNDNFISREEFDAAASEKADRMKERRDANGDGKVNREDRKSRRKKLKEMRQAKKDKRDGEQMRDRKNKRVKLDANEDGVVSYAEHQAATEAMFDRLDANGDGVLSQGEGRKNKSKRRRSGK